MDSTPTIKKAEQLKQKPQAPIGQAKKMLINTKVNNERPAGAFRLLSTKFDTVSLTSGTKSPVRMNKQCNTQGSTKSLQRSYSIERMDCDTDHTIAHLNLEDITNNYYIWNHLTVQTDKLNLLNVTYKPST